MATDEAAKSRRFDVGKRIDDTNARIKGREPALSLAQLLYTAFGFVLALILAAKGADFLQNHSLGILSVQHGWHQLFWWAFVLSVIVSMTLGGLLASGEYGSPFLGLLIVLAVLAFVFFGFWWTLLWAALALALFILVFAIVVG